MGSISPRVASELADLVYQIKSPDSFGNYRVNLANLDVNRYFNFDFSSGPVHGRTGGLFGIYKKTTGFAIIGQGKNQNENDYVVAVRGTSSKQDWLTNFNVGFSPASNNSSVHAGFNRTFESMKPVLNKQLSSHLRKKSQGVVHCVGHSLGGALASLIAVWIKAEYRRPVNLYTFGAPRVGLEGFASKSSAGIEQIYRCTHGADVVPKVPLWPFIHAPNHGGSEFRLDSSEGINIEAHLMGVDHVPGYRNTANSNDWDKLYRKSSDYLSQPVRLSYQRRHQASFSAYWADRLNAALVTLLKDAGYYTAVVAQATVGTSLTFYDMLARTLEQVANASNRFAEQTAGLLGHMLVFAGKVGVKVGELSYAFIRWVFDRTVGALYRAVRQALDAV